MKVIIRYFGPAREIVGTEEEELVVNEGSTVAEIRQTIPVRYPAMQRLIAACRVAVNMRYASDDELIPDGAEIALIPPVAGG